MALPRLYHCRFPSISLNAIHHKAEAGPAPGRDRPRSRRGFLFAAETKPHADVGGAAERRKSEHILIGFVEQIGDMADNVSLA
jgi:hypothetical protein